jgi:hypothetical protein
MPQQEQRRVSASSFDLQLAEPDAKLLGCIDKGLESFGSTFGKVVYWKLDSFGSLTREQIPNRLDDFVSQLIDMFGDGSKSVERAIIRELRKKTTLVDLSSDDLLTALRKARNNFRAMSGIGPSEK